MRFYTAAMTFEDPVAAAGRWVDAAAAGDPVALGELGAALGGLTQRADQGDPIAQRTLGFVLQHGVGTASDRGRAAELYRAAAASGDPWAAYNLGVLAGRSAESIPWLRLAAEGGLVPAFPALGDRLSDHDLDEEALQWYVKGAEAGDKGSMFAAACWYRDGFGGPVDLVQALRWYLAMLDIGSGDGIHEAHQIAPAMSDDQIRAAGRLAGRITDAEIFLTQRAET